MTESVIGWTVNPNHFLTLDTIIARYYKSTLFHDFNHLVRGWTAQSSRQSLNFMDAVLAEGLATTFEMTQTGQKPMWAEIPADIDGWVSELLHLDASAYTEYRKWMFEHPNGRLWIGYKVGTYIIKKVTEKSNLDVLELTTLPTADLLKLAEFKQ